MDSGKNQMFTIKICDESYGLNIKDTAAQLKFYVDDLISSRINVNDCNTISRTYNLDKLNSVDKANCLNVLFVLNRFIDFITNLNYDAFSQYEIVMKLIDVYKEKNIASIDIPVGLNEGDHIMAQNLLNKIKSFLTVYDALSVLNIIKIKDTH